MVAFYKKSINWSNIFAYSRYILSANKSICKKNISAVVNKVVWVSQCTWSVVITKKRTRQWETTHGFPTCEPHSNIFLMTITLLELCAMIYMAAPPESQRSQHNGCCWRHGIYNSYDDVVLSTLNVCAMHAGRLLYEYIIETTQFQNFIFQNIKIFNALSRQHPQTID